MQKKERIILDASHYSAVRLVTRILLILRGIIVARLLGPSLFGIWNILLVFLSYSQHSHLGLREAMLKEIPFYKGRMEPERSELVKNTVYYEMIFISLAISASLLLASFLLPDTYSSVFITGLRLIALVVILQQLYSFYLGLLAANSNFIVIGKITLIFTFLSVITIYPLILMYELNGAIFSITISYVIALILIRKTKRYIFHMNIRFDEIVRLLKVGFPLLLISFMYELLGSIDKLMIAGLINETELGYYSIGVVIANLIFYVPSVIGSVIFPSMMEIRGATDKLNHLKNYIIEPTFALSYLMPLIIGVTYLMFPLFIKGILPEYIPGVNAAKILVVLMFFMSLSTISNKFAIAIDKQSSLFMLQIFALFLNVALNYTFIMIGWGIEGVSLGTGITYIVYGSMVITYSTSKVYSRLTDQLKFFAKIYLPFFYLAILLFLIEYVLLAEKVDIISTISKTILFVLFNIPLFIYLNRKTNVVHSFIRILKSIKWNKQRNT
ncbi:oligosaccharide flippase family protein [Methanolobus bombayensis]|uniref:oligosaccharide flippase family protein n=1 Tax=Methanolobus bombayensis TaxID=38023 RepID=UPI001AE50B62|nr:oligosaccharide flippase family protein [Methanolobus bombayensis]MBP1908197.1 O-antigen/teichoic acid export membrane protein [Methanolobus bombayensis]